MIKEKQLRNKIMVAVLLIAVLVTGMEEKSRNRIIVTVLLIVSLVIGSGVGRADIDGVEKIMAAELAAMATHTEIQHQRILDYRLDLVDMQAKLDKSQARPPELIPRGTPLEIIKEVPVKIEVVREVFRDFREFEDLAELKDWLRRNGLPVRLLVGENGKVDFLNPESTSQYDCDDYAEALQRKALDQGLLMSQQLILDGTIYGVKVSEIAEPHMGNLAIIGNDIYYVESVPPHSVVRITSRD